jgi:hypothetical protein
VHFLSEAHIVLEKGIATDPEKIVIIKGWPKQNNISKVRSFIVVVGYYIRFIEGYSNISHLITSLQKKGIEFEWTTECEEIF